MCFPCMTWSDAYVEEPKQKKKRKTKDPILVWDPKANSWVKLTGVKFPFTFTFTFIFTFTVTVTVPSLSHFHTNNLKVFKTASIRPPTPGKRVHFASRDSLIPNIMSPASDTASQTPAQSFQPQVPDANYGPQVHQYIIRTDGTTPTPDLVGLGATAGQPPLISPMAVYPAMPYPPGLQQPQYQYHMVVPPIPYCHQYPPLQPQAQPYFHQMGCVHHTQPVQVHPQPIFQPQPIYQQQPTMAYPPWMQPQQVQPIYQPGVPYIQQPAVDTWGHTNTEIQQQQMARAAESKHKIQKKQEMKPTDDDPLRVYWVRELDNTWTQRNRLTIDSGDIGDCRWYVIDGMFYAVRLSMGA